MNWNESEFKLLVLWHRVDKILGIYLFNVRFRKFAYDADYDHFHECSWSFVLGDWYWFNEARLCTGGPVLQLLKRWKMNSIPFISRPRACFLWF